ncbi:MAG: hypothetical protein K6G63_08630 [Eubacterium sp.]|nr:hypothetical protein [Eubacterium sp.]
MEPLYNMPREIAVANSIIFIAFLGVYTTVIYRLSAYKYDKISLYIGMVLAIKCFVFMLASIVTGWEMAGYYSGREYTEFEFFLLSFPVWLYIFGVVEMSVGLFVLNKRIFRNKKSRIDAMNLKESLDTLPMGICYYTDTGLIRLMNHFMMDVSEKLMGRIVDNGFDLKRRAFEGVSDDETAIVEIGDGRVMAFNFDYINVRNAMMSELIVTDVTELYNINKQLEEYNEEQEKNIKLREEINKSIKMITIQQEELKAKINIHDSLGYAGLATRKALEDGFSEEGVRDLGKMWRDNMSMLKRFRTRGDDTNSFDRLLEAAKNVGVEIKIDNITSQIVLKNDIIVIAVHECLTNAIRHAKATQMNIVSRDDNGRIMIKITNNGKVPEADICETGGLGMLRTKVENAGGKMWIESMPRFELSISFPKV